MNSPKWYAKPMRALSFALGCSLLSALTASMAWSQPEQTAPIADGSISLPSQIEIARLIDLVASRTGSQISYDPQELAGSLTLRSSEALDNRSLWLLTNDLLVSKGLTTIVRPGSTTYSVVKVADAAAAARIDESPFVSAIGLPFEPGFVSRRLKLNAAAPADAIDQAKILLSPATSKISSAAGSQSLLISDLTPRVNHAIRVISELDLVASGSTTMELRALNVPPAQLASAAMSVAAKRNQTGVAAAPLCGEVIASPTTNGVILIAPAADVPQWRSLLSLLDQPQDSITKVYTLKRFPLADVADLVQRLGSGSSSGDSAVVVRDELTNSLVVTARPSKQDEIAALIDRLESTPGDGSRPVREFAIRNRPVNELLSTLSSMIAAGAIDAAIDSAADGGPDRDLVRSSGDQSQLAIESVGARRAGLNEQPASLATSDTAQRSVPETLPSRNPASLSLTIDPATNTLIAIGSPRQLLQLERLIEKLDVRQPQVMVEVLLVSLSESDTLNLGVELDKIDTVGDTTIRLASLFGLGTTSGQTASLVGGTAAIFSPGEFSVLVRALQNLNRGRSVSIPRVLVNNNQVASFGSTVQQPFATSNATNSSTTITFGGSQSAGTTISITPQISEGDHLILTYNVSLSSFVGSPTSTGLPPPRQENRIDSVATIPDGYTVAVGGLDLTTTTRGTTQVPLIAEVPLIGELFKTRDNSDSRSRFYVFIRANVMRHDAMLDLKYASDRDASEAAIQGGWPEIKPQVIR